MRIKCDEKRVQYYLSALIVLFTFIHYLKIDTFKCTLYITLMHSFLFVAPKLWGRPLYEGLTEDGQLKFSYKTFQCALTLLLSVMLIFFIYGIVTDYKPENYVAGVC